MDEPRSINLVWDDSKLDSYINNSLRVFTLKNTLVLVMQIYFAIAYGSSTKR